MSVFTTQTSSHTVLTSPKQSKSQSLCKPALETQDHEDECKDCGEESRLPCADDVQPAVDLVEQVLEYETRRKALSTVIEACIARLYWVGMDDGSGAT